MGANIGGRNSPSTNSAVNTALAIKTNREDRPGQTYIPQRLRVDRIG